MHRSNELLVTDIPRRNMYSFPNKTAVVFKDRRITHLGFFERTNRIANVLIELGIKKKEVCALLSMNSSECLECYYAVPKAGGIYLPLNYRLTARELLYIIDDSSAKILIYEERFQDIIEEIKLKSKVREFIVLRPSIPQQMEYEQLLAQSSKEEPEIARSQLISEDELCLMYTSGTTGFPKGAVLTHRNMVANMWSVQAAYRCTHHDIHLNVMPLYHGGGLQYTAVHYSVGGTVVILERYDIEEFFKLVEKESITTAFLGTFMLRQMAEARERMDYNISSMRLIFYGGSAFTIEQFQKVYNSFKCQFTQGYGMTELGPRGVTYFTPEDHRAIIEDPSKGYRINSSGVVTPTVEFKIVDVFDRTLSAGITGEICVRGEPVFKCYWNNEKETKKVIRNGWFYTGDMGYFDEDGYLYVVDRKKDMIKSGGENIYCLEVERAICKHPFVKECVVFGIPDEKWEETVHAMIVLEANMSVSEKEIVEFCKKQIASYKKPRSVEFVESLPKNAIGKVIKKDLKRRFS